MHKLLLMKVERLLGECSTWWRRDWERWTWRVIDRHRGWSGRIRVWFDKPLILRLQERFRHIVVDSTLSTHSTVSRMIQLGRYFMHVFVGVDSHVAGLMVNHHEGFGLDILALQHWAWGLRDWDVAGSPHKWLRMERPRWKVLVGRRFGGCRCAEGRRLGSLLMYMCEDVSWCHTGTHHHQLWRLVSVTANQVVGMNVDDRLVRIVRDIVGDVGVENRRGCQGRTSTIRYWGVDVGILGRRIVRSTQMTS